MENPLTTFLKPIAEQMPTYLPFDGVVMSVALYFYLTTYTSLPMDQVRMAVGVAGMTHIGLHGIACSSQDRFFSFPN